MADCVTCGDGLHPERAQKYDYCTKRECRERTANPSAVVAVGVNKAADQYVVLNERTKKEMASGRYKKQPDADASLRRRARSRQVRDPQEVPAVVPRSSAAAVRRRWSEVQESLALTYRAMGMNPDAIANKLGVSPSLVTQILLSATSRGRR